MQADEASADFKEGGDAKGELTSLQLVADLFPEGPAWMTASKKSRVERWGFCEGKDWVSYLSRVSM